MSNCVAVTIIAPEKPSTSANVARIGHHEHGRDEPRDHELLDGVGAERADGVDLLGDGHRADLGGHARADAPADDDGGERRRELAREREPDDAARVLHAAELLQAERELHGHDHADEDAVTEAMPTERTPSDSIW